MLSTYAVNFKNQLVSVSSAALYIHIPFCKKACSYCDFHFSTTFKNKSSIIKSLQSELVLQASNAYTPISSIYFGGGTPSILSIIEIEQILNTIQATYTLTDSIEITLEANPDDLTPQFIKELSCLPINRLSIGVQSYFDDDLKLMNRSHSAQQSVSALLQAKQYFDNITIDLIYGVPNMTLDKWNANIEQTLQLQIPHISAYALTVEPKTQLQYAIKQGLISPPSDTVAQQHFYHLKSVLQANNYTHYELSNFGKENYFSIHNSSYWFGKPYIGIGPSAHSYNPHSQTRSWNIANNTKYLNALTQGILPSESEQLSLTDRFNEYLITGLRTQWGISLAETVQLFGEEYSNYLTEHITTQIKNGLLEINQNQITLSAKGIFLMDSVLRDLLKI